MSKRLIFLLFIFTIAYNTIAMDTFEGIEPENKVETKLNYNIKGILNNNSNCFMSAVLQCIIQNKEWVSKVLNSSANNYLKKLLNNLIDPKENVLNIEDLYEYMVGEYFSGNYWQHQDAHQFLINFFNEFTTDCGDFQNVECTINQCINCGNLTKNYSPFYTLSLSINNHTKDTNIEDLLEKHFNFESTNFNCHCGHNTCKKQLKIHNLPKYLILDIKRFNFDHNLLTNTKVNLPVHIKELLTLKSEYFENLNSNPVYKLQGLVEHHSNFLNEDDANAGHYTSCVNYDNKWYKCDDLTIKPIDDITDNTSSYILFYKLEPKIKSNFVCNFCNKDCKYKKVLSNHIDRFHYYENNQPTNQQMNIDLQGDFQDQDQYMQDYSNSSYQSPNFVLHSPVIPEQIDSYEDLYDTETGSYNSSLQHTNENVLEDSSGNEQESNIVCDICNKVCKDRRALYNHKLTHGKPGESYICDTCNKVYKDRMALNQHKRTHGKPGESYICDVCNKDCNNPIALREHKRTHGKPGESYICDICNKDCRNPKSLYEHKRTHGKPGESYICDICNEDCRNPKSLYEHKRTHGKPGESYICETCNQVCKDKRALYDHKRTHPKPGESYICNFVDSKGKTCHKDCGNEKALNRHKQTHPKPGETYICNICNQDYGNTKSLHEHMKTHPKPGESYICETCNNNCNTPIALREHKLTHGKPGESYICKTCSKDCRNPKALYNHNHRTCKPDKPPKSHACDICNIDYGNQSVLNSYKCDHIERNNDSPK